MYEENWIEVAINRNMKGYKEQSEENRKESNKIEDEKNAIKVLKHVISSSVSMLSGVVWA